MASTVVMSQYPLMEGHLSEVAVHATVDTEYLIVAIDFRAYALCAECGKRAQKMERIRHFRRSIFNFLELRDWAFRGHIRRPVFSCDQPKAADFG